MIGVLNILGFVARGCWQMGVPIFSDIGPLAFRSTQELFWQPFSLVSESVCITNNCSLLAFPLPVSLVLPLLLSIHLELVTVLDYS